MSKRKKTKDSPDKSIIGKIKSSILDLFDNNPGRAYSIKQIAKKIGLKKRDDIKTATFIIFELEESGKIKELSNGTYSAKQSGSQTSGIVDHVNARFAYVRIGEGKSDVYVKTRDLGSAMDGDTVTLNIMPGRQGEHPEGRVVNVLKRNRTRFVGKLELSKNYAFVVPDFRKIHQDFFVYPEHINGAKSNDKVIVEIIEWASGDKNPTAKVVDILGKAGENDAEIHSIMAEFGLPFEFPEKVEKEANKIDEGFNAAEIKKRWDFRKTLTFTIDPEDAKDFDDALSIETLPDGNYQIGVHIADVTHYVQLNTELEKEAFDRATSVYLVDRTIPMLPEKLSNRFVLVTTKRR